MRVAAAIFVALHGLGHIIWFMATWARWSLGGSGRTDLAKHESRFQYRRSARWANWSACSPSRY
jgi:hypothetical protein